MNCDISEKFYLSIDIRVASKKNMASNIKSTLVLVFLWFELEQNSHRIYRRCTEC